MGITDDRRRRDDSWDAEAIRSLRRHAKLSQRELAEELNARQQTISEWERGEYAPRGTAARLLTRVAEDVQFPFEAGPSPVHDSAEDMEQNIVHDIVQESVLGDDADASESGRAAGDD